MANIIITTIPIAKLIAASIITELKNGVRNPNNKLLGNIIKVVTASKLRSTLTQKTPHDFFGDCLISGTMDVINSP